MPGYKHPCQYCGELIPPESNVCPLCGKVNPLEPVRCPKCRNPVEKNWKKCSSCGLTLEIDCRKCGKKTFFGDYCDSCGEKILAVCSNPKCKTEQPPLGDKCVKCGSPIK
jgi:hypothetical protein